MAVGFKSQTGKENPKEVKLVVSERCRALVSAVSERWLQLFFSSFLCCRLCFPSHVWMCSQNVETSLFPQSSHESFICEVAAQLISFFILWKCGLKIPPKRWTQTFDALKLEFSHTSVAQKLLIQKQQSCTFRCFWLSVSILTSNEWNCSRLMMREPRIYGRTHTPPLLVS